MLTLSRRRCIAVFRYVQKQRDKGVWIDDQVAQLYEGDLNPVAPRAQSKVPVPEGLDLDKRINKEKKYKEIDDNSDMFNWMSTVQVDESMFDVAAPKAADYSEEELELRRKARENANEANVFHLGGGMVNRPAKANDEGGAVDVDQIPIETLDIDIGTIMVGPDASAGLSKKELKARRKELKRLKKEGKPIPAEYAEPEKPVVATVFDMPEGAELEDAGNGPELSKDDPHRALGEIDLSAPSEGVMFEQPQHHVAKSMTAKEAEALEIEKAKAARKAAKKAKKDKKEKKEKKKKEAKAEGDSGADMGSGGATAAAPEPELTLDQVEAEGPLEVDAELASFLDDKPKDKKKNKKDKKDKKKKKKKDTENREDFQVLLSPAPSGRSSPAPMFSTSEYRPLTTESDKGLKVRFARSAMLASGSSHVLAPRLCLTRASARTRGTPSSFHS